MFGLFGTYILFTAWDQLKEEYQQRAEAASPIGKWMWRRPWPSRSRWVQLLLGWAICLIAIIGGLSMLIN
jgi:hypothetical protein